MKIAQIAPLTESVPPKLYGGTERIVSDLTEELVRQGHEVTLFASGDFITAARLAPIIPWPSGWMRRSAIHFPTKSCCSSACDSVPKASTCCTSTSTSCNFPCSGR